MSVTIEPYTSVDRDTVAAIWLYSWRSTGLPIAKLVSFDDLRWKLAIEVERGWTVHVARIEGQIVGFIALHDDWLVQLFVAPKSQGQGIGKILLDFAKAQRPQGFQLDTAAESGAVRFYEREGLARGEVARHPRFGHLIVHYDWQPGRRCGIQTI